ncbi:cyclic GMP-AMP synthase isoform X2 [Petaurus breviceps papuanus]|uniref:cyclic GMP-AMP synthase isoform X2 n=1 Tax=Petaurus breviceps papuanus TaxID=3040969 RepID=UPI0036D8429D
MEGKVRRASSARRKGSTQGSGKTQAARTRAPCQITSQVAPDLADAAPGKASHSSGSESLREKKPLILQEGQPPVVREKKPPVLREKQPPVLQEKQPPVLRQKKSPVVQEKQPPALQERPPPVVQEKRPPVLRQKQPPVLQERQPPVVQEKRPPVLREKKPPVLQEKRPARTPGSQATTKGLPHPGDGHTQQEGRRVLKEDSPPRVRTTLSNEPGILPKEKRDPGLQQVVEKLKLRRQATSQACGLVNKIVDHLLRQLPLCDQAFEGIVKKGTGSYYEQVKICAPNEFDIMLRLQVSRIELEDYDDSGAYYFVKFKRNPKGNPLTRFLDNEILSASKLLSQFRKIIKAEVNKIKANTWRLSFSHIEKDILRNHGSSKTCCETNGVPCCRKTCLKLMKYLLEQLKKKFENRKELDKFNSYHMKTTFFHLCAQKPDDSQWQVKDLEQCFDNCVSYFLQCLQAEQLLHFFIPSYNMFSRDLIGKTSQEFLLRQIEFQRNNMFPVFDE